MTPALDFALIFQTSSSAAMTAWVVLILAPRPTWLMHGLRYGLIGALAVVYGMLMALYFFRVPGGGYDSIEQVRTLMMSDPVLTAGWIHYLAFDLFVGLWIAQRADELGFSRWLQAPILALTFLFGPIGWLAFAACRAALPLEARLRGQPT
jgi:hypothetical protein